MQNWGKVILNEHLHCSVSGQHGNGTLWLDAVVFLCLNVTAAIYVMS